jgi:peptidoglycan-associated lipoprotein
LGLGSAAAFLCFFGRNKLKYKYRPVFGFKLFLGAKRRDGSARQSRQYTENFFGFFLGKTVFSDRNLIFPGLLGPMFQERENPDRRRRLAREFQAPKYGMVIYSALLKLEESSMKRVFFLAALALCLGLVVVGCRSKQDTGGVVETDGERQAFLNNHVYFDFDRYNIRPDQVPVIASKAAYLTQINTSARVELQGYCDERGTEAYNNALADRRAKSAYNYLVDQGVSGSRLVTVSYGEEFPADPGHNEAAWAKNRRVQSVLQ